MQVASAALLEHAGAFSRVFLPLHQRLAMIHARGVVEGEKARNQSPSPTLGGRVSMAHTSIDLSDVARSALRAALATLDAGIARCEEEIRVRERWETNRRTNQWISRTWTRKTCDLPVTNEWAEATTRSLGPRPRALPRRVPHFPAGRRCLG